MLDKEKQLLCDFYDQLTTDQRRIIMGTARRCATANQERKPKLRLVVSAPYPHQPQPEPPEVPFLSIRVATS